MSREEDLERQLRSFGDTLRQQVGEPIDPISLSGRPGIDDGPDRRDRRRWAALVAAAAVVALVVGLLALVQVGDEADTPVVTQPTTPTTTSTTAQPTSPALAMIDHVVLVDGEAVGEPWTTGVASTSDELTVLWGELGLQGAAPAVDFTDDVVLYFNPAESGSCRFGPLDGVAHDSATGRLFPVLPYQDPATDVIDGERICTSDANPHAVLVEIARSDLPSADFVVWVNNFDPPAMVRNRVTRVAASELLTALTTTPPAATIVGTSARSGGFDGPVVFGQEPVDPSTPVAEAAGGGTLRLVEGCLVAETAVGDGSATQQTLIVWGFGTTWDPATASVVLDDGHRIAVGEEFETGGGYYPLGAMNRYIGDLAAEARIRACSQLLGTAELFIQSPFPR